MPANTFDNSTKRIHSNHIFTSSMTPHHDATLFLEEFSSFEEKELVHIIDGLWVTGNEVAFIEEGVEFGEKKFAKGGGIGLHSGTSL